MRGTASEKLLKKRSALGCAATHWLKQKGKSRPATGRVEARPLPRQSTTLRSVVTSSVASWMPPSSTLINTSLQPASDAGVWESTNNKNFTWDNLATGQEPVWVMRREGAWQDFCPLSAGWYLYLWGEVTDANCLLYFRNRSLLCTVTLGSFYIFVTVKTFSLGFIAVINLLVHILNGIPSPTTITGKSIWTVSNNRVR